MEEVCKNIYHVKIPLVHSPLKELNCYMIRGDQRNLIIDTGFNQPDAKAALIGAMERLGFEPESTDVFLTHLHTDHSGLICALKNPQNHVYTSKTDGMLTNRLLTKAYWDEVEERNILMGFPADEMLDIHTHPAYAYRADGPVAFDYADPGDGLAVGEYRFTVVDMAGHTPGQVGLYEENHKICFCADHILAKISPNIIAWDLEHDYLGIFLENLRRVRGMEIRHLFGGHRGVVSDHRARIDELFAHHQKRLEEALEALETGPKTVYQTAGRLSWDFSGGNFPAFPLQQKWFAVSEAFAHLQHLLFEGQVRRFQEGQTLLYALM